MTADPRGDRRIQLGGRRRVLRYDFNALCDLERALGVIGVVALKQRLNDFGFATIRAFVWAAVLHDEPDVSLREVGGWLGTDLKKLEQVGEAVGEAFVAAFPDATKATTAPSDDESDPTRGTGDSPYSEPQPASE